MRVFLHLENDSQNASADVNVPLVNLHADEATDLHIEPCVDAALLHSLSLLRFLFGRMLASTPRTFFCCGESHRH